MIIRPYRSIVVSEQVPRYGSIVADEKGRSSAAPLLDFETSVAMVVDREWVSAPEVTTIDRYLRPLRPAPRL